MYINIAPVVQPKPATLGKLGNQNPKGAASPAGSFPLVARGDDLCGPEQSRPQASSLEIEKTTTISLVGAYLRLQLATTAKLFHDRHNPA